MRTKQPCPYAGERGFLSGRKNKLTGDWFLIYDYNQRYGGPYLRTRFMVVCAAHGRSCRFRSMSEAVTHAKEPWRFCSECSRLPAVKQKEIDFSAAEVTQFTLSEMRFTVPDLLRSERFERLVRDYFRNAMGTFVIESDFAHSQLAGRQNG